MNVTRVLDFHVHYTPEDIVRPQLDASGAPAVVYAGGIPSYTQHEGLFRLERHLECMDAAGVDVAVLSSGAGMGAPQEVCEHINADLAKVAGAHAGRFRPLAHVDPTDGRWVDELRRCAREYGFPGVAFPTSFASCPLDDPLQLPVFEEIARLGLFVFVHPSLAVPRGLEAYYDRYDLYRCVGREHELVLATYRLIAGGVFDRVPDLRVVMSHLGGGIAAVVHRIRGYQDKEHMGLRGESAHTRVAARPFDEYFERNLYFDTGGVFGSVKAVRAALTEIPAGRIVFGSDYPQEIRTADALATFVRDLRESGLPAQTVEGILGGNGAALLEGTSGDGAR